jgi:hypothetical protein
MDITFWGSAGTDFPNIRYEDGTLVSPKPHYSRLVSGGRHASLPVGEFDTMVLYACQIDLFRVARRLVGLFDPQKTYSSAFRHEALDECMAKWWSSRSVVSLIEHIRREFPALRLVVYPNPYWSPNCALFQVPTQQRAMAAAMGEVASFAERRFVGLGCEFRLQRPETVERGIFSRMDLSKGSIKNVSGGVPHDDIDHVHMNSEYGVVMLRDILSALASGEHSGRKSNPLPV